MQTGSENEERSGDDDDDPSNPANIDDLMPDIYSQLSDDTVPYLKIIKDQSQATDKSTGFDPYDTAKFHKK